VVDRKKRKKGEKKSFHLLHLKKGEIGGLAPFFHRQFWAFPKKSPGVSFFSSPLDHISQQHLQPRLM
jgi:hypothetical protein